jgi:hypothetical protein
MKKWIFAFAVLFAAAFTFGCTGGEEEGPNVGAGYTIDVSDTSVVEGSVVNVKLTLTNPYENDMVDINAELVGFDKGRFSPDPSEPETIGTLEPGQTFPIIWTIDMPEALNTDTETFSPRAKVCFSTEGTYFFDMVLLPKAGVEEMPILTSGASLGPVAITQSGLSEVYTREGERTTKGTIDFTNIGPGGIQKIEEITLTVPGEDEITDASLAYSSCVDELCGNRECVLNKDTKKPSCEDKLYEELIVQNGITVTAGYTTDGEIDDSVILRPSGGIKYDYCYNLDIGQVTVCRPGKC